MASATRLSVTLPWQRRLGLPSPDGETLHPFATSRGRSCRWIFTAHRSLISFSPACSSAWRPMEKIALVLCRSLRFQVGSGGWGATGRRAWGSGITPGPPHPRIFVRLQSKRLPSCCPAGAFGGLSERGKGQGMICHLHYPAIWSPKRSLGEGGHRGIREL